MKKKTHYSKDYANETPICKTNGTTGDCTSTFDDLNPHEWSVTFSDGVVIHGKASCNSTSGNSNTWGSGSWQNLTGNSHTATTFNTTSTGDNCWCQLDSRTDSTTVTGLSKYSPVLPSLRRSLPVSSNPQSTSISHQRSEMHYTSLLNQNNVIW